MPGKYGQSYTDNHGSIWNWNEGTGSYVRMKTQARDRSATPTINTSAFSRQFTNRRAVKVNPDGNTRNTVGGGTPTGQSPTVDKSIIPEVISLAKRNYTPEEISDKTGTPSSQVSRIVTLAIEKGHKIGKKTERELLDEQLFELLEYGDESGDVQKSLNEDLEVIQKSEALQELPETLPISLNRLNRLMEARTDYLIQQSHSH